MYVFAKLSNVKTTKRKKEKSSQSRMYLTSDFLSELILYSKDSITMQLETRPLQFYKKPPFSIKAFNDSVLLTCSAYGYPQEMDGKWISYNSQRVTFNITRNKNSLTVASVVKRSGTYSCQIKDRSSVIESVTTIRFMFLSKSKEKILFIFQAKLLKECVLQIS